ncbi:hypothetical protein AQUCO_00100600v1 [Aquilegia coerulea]|uniref:DUF4371 domain-containing protein n=1 Tax=Aquilegia coerulea TaxID=218851 RepID=A0A2G5FB89_AQUCA|nr:hypothetical protein AQUCO_00100600v1 [Aquilegia coerulea]
MLGDHNSGHNRACLKSENLMKQEQHIETILVKQSDQELIDYQICLTVSLDCIRFLSHQGLAFRGHDESENSKNRGNFLELFKFLASHDEKVDSVSLKNVPQNNLLTSSDIKKDLVNSYEQMAICLRYVDKRGCFERFVGMMYVPDTTSSSLKASLGELFGKHGLSFMRLHGQGYDEASNMQGQFNGLKALIFSENKSTIYAANVFMQLKSNELSSSKGLNQEIDLKRPSDTLWGSHYGTLVNFIVIFSSVVETLDEVMEESSSSNKKGETQVLLDLMHSFEFCFILYLMRNLLGITNDLSKALQRKYKDIVNAIAFGENKFIHRGRSRSNAEEITNVHYYQVRFFYGCIDKQHVELDTVLISNLFSAFDVEKLIRLAEFYPDDFSEQERMVLRNQLEIYEINIKSKNTFVTLKGINSLATTMVECGKNITYDLVYTIIKLSLILLVSTATNRLRNGMGDEWMNDCLVTYIEKTFLILSTMNQS